MNTTGPLGSLALWGAIGACATPVHEPRLDDVSPGLVCQSAELDEVLILIGANLGPSVAGGLGERPSLEGPTVTLTRRLGLGGAENDPAETVLSSSDPRMSIVSSDRIEVQLDRFLGLQAGRFDLLVDVAGHKGIRKPDAFAVIGAPTGLRLSPADLCDGAGATTLIIEGEGLLSVDGALPSIRLADQLRTVDSLSGCTSLPQDPRIEVCTQASLQLSPGELPNGIFGLNLVNPSPGDCEISAPVALSVHSAPSLLSVAPADFCDTGARLRIEGSGLIPDMEAVIAGVSLGPVEWIDSRTVFVDVPAGALPRGPQDLRLESPGGCDATLAAAVNVHIPPIVFAVDPPIAPLGLALQVRASLAGVFDEITQVTLVDDVGLTVSPAWIWDPEDPDAVQVTLPDSLHAGLWQITIDQGADCPGTPSATVEVLDADMLPLEAVEPAQAWAFAPTAIEVSLTDPIPSSALGLEPGARAWLVDAMGAAAPVRVYAAETRSDTLLTGIVPEGMDPGSYDLLVLNPRGAAGFLDGAIEVRTLEPPSIRSARPGTLENRGSPQLSIRGAGFRDPTVTLECRDGGTTTAMTSVTVSASYNEVVVVPDVSAVSQAVCVVTLENVDGAVARFSAISITNPAQNLFPWQVGAELNTARRAPAAAAGRTSSVRRWLYAVGGDPGDISGAFASVEVAPVGVFGDLGPWRSSPRSLPDARTLAGIVRIEDFLYLVGGSDSAAAVQSTLRAQILDPLLSPWFGPVGLEPATHGLAPGTWSYRVSALFPADHDANPGGESLAADLLLVTVPDTGDGWAVTLSWQAVAGAESYRIYRSPTLDAVPGLEESLLAEVTGQILVDRGDEVDLSVRPLREGDLGEWATVQDLISPRRSPCVTTAADPFPDPEVVYIYAAGGADSGGRLLDSTEVLAVTIEAPGRQVVGRWEVAPARLSRARERCGAMSVESTWHSVVEPGESWVYFAGGRALSGAVGAVDAFRVDEGGVLVEDGATRSMTPARAGFAPASASNFLYAFGGQQDSPSSGGASAELESTRLPDVRNWNSLSTSLAEPRHLPGSAQESAVLFVVGGETDSSTATPRVDWTNF